MSAVRRGATFFSQRIGLAILVVSCALIPLREGIAACPDLAAPVSYAVGSSPDDVAVGDFNGDARIDLAVANRDSNDVSVLVGNGDGSFAAAVNYAVGTTPRSVVSADFNSDGRIDLAIVNSGSSTLSILFGNGDGTFAAAVQVAAGSGFGSNLVVSDFNGDGRADLALPRSSGVSIFLGNGDGTFTAKVVSTLSSGPYFAAVADFDADGNSDLAVASYPYAGAQDVVILLGDGAGSFTRKSAYAVGDWTSSVAVGDLNGDGRMDIVAVNDSISAESYPLVELFGNGDGTFTQANVRDYAKYVAIGDLNGDGHDELSWTVSNIIRMRLGDGAGGFGPIVDFTGTGKFWRLAFGDFNSDTRRDVVVTNSSSNEVSVLLNQGHCNGVPWMTPVTKVTLTSGSPDAVFTIADVYDAEDVRGTLTVTAVTLPDGVTLTDITNSDGTISARIGASCSLLGSPNATLQVQDSGGATATATLNLQIFGNPRPSGLAYATTTVVPGGSVNVTPTSPLSDNVMISQVTVSAPAAFTGTVGIDPATSVVSVDNAGPAGAYTISVKAYDNCNAYTVFGFTLIVNSVPPTITAANGVTRTGGSANSRSLIAVVSDADESADKLGVGRSTAPAGLSIAGPYNFAGNVFADISATCSAAAGPYVLTLTVRDSGGATADAPLTIDVIANPPPTVGAYADTTVIAGRKITVTPDATPTDNGSVTLSAVASSGFTGTLSTNASTGAVTVTSPGPVGSHTITVTVRDNCAVITTKAFTLTVEAPIPPTIATVGTITRVAGSSLPSVVATVSDPDGPAWILSVWASSVPAGMNVHGFTNSNGTITAVVAPSCTASVGSYAVTLSVRDSDGATATGTLTVNVTTNTPPTLGDYLDSGIAAGGSGTITPSAAPADDGTVAVGVSPSAGFTGTVSANSTTGLVTVSNAGPAGSYLVTVTATDNCGLTTSKSFVLTVASAPGIASFSPSGGPAGIIVTITGTHFTGATAVAFNGTAATFAVVSDTQITATVPNGATPGYIRVTAPGGVAQSATSFAAIPAPVISSFTPQSGPIGTKVTITGWYFTGTTLVRFAGVPATFTVVSSTTIEAFVPEGATTGAIAVTTPGGTAVSISSVTVSGAAPTVQGSGSGPGSGSGSGSSGSGTPGDFVTITGSGFTCVTAVYFNGVSATFNIVSDSVILAQVPAGATTGAITLTGPCGTQTTTGVFTVEQPNAPTIESFSPSSGGPSAIVTIRGTNFTGATGVTFGGIAATDFTVVSPTEITVAVPNGARTGPITVTKTAGSAKSPLDFYVPSATPPPNYTFTRVAGTAGGADNIDGVASAARFRRPTGLARDAAGNVYVADAEAHTIRMISAGGNVTTLAGRAFHSGLTNGSGAAARFNTPSALALATDGSLYVADRENHVIRKIDLLGAVTTYAGSTAACPPVDGTLATAKFCRPSGLAFDAAGTLWVADGATIRKISTTGTVTTVAGLSLGYADGSGAAAKFNDVRGIAVAADGSAYVADYGNWCVRRVTPAGGVTTLAKDIRNVRAVAVGADGTVYAAADHGVVAIPTGGGATFFAGGNSSGTSDGEGSAARFNGPEAIVGDGGTGLVVADSRNHALRLVSSTGLVTTWAGLPAHVGAQDGTGSAARFTFTTAPWMASSFNGAAVDAAGNVYVSDDQTIRKITPAGEVSTLAGSAGIADFADGTGAAARFNYPSGLAVDSQGNVWVADYGNGLVRKINPSGDVTTVAGSVLLRGSTDGPVATALFGEPLGIAVDDADNVYVGDIHYLKIRKISGGQVTTVYDLAGGRSEWKVGEGPWGATADATGNVYFVNQSPSTSSIVKIPASGSVVEFGSLPIVTGIASIPDGTLFVTSGNSVYAIDAAGNAVPLNDTTNRSGSADGTAGLAQLAHPTGLAAGSAGTLYVVDEQNRSIRSFSPAIDDAAIISTGNSCAGAEHTLSTLPDTAATWLWTQTRIPSRSSASLSSTFTRSTSFTPDVADEYEFRLTCTAGGGATSITALTLDATTNDPAITAVSPVCAQAESTASVEAHPGWTYEWNVSNGTINAGQGTDSITWVAGAGGDATVSVSIGTACGTRTASEIVVVNPQPSAAIHAPSSVCVAMTSARASVADAGLNAAYSWTITNGTIVGGQGTQAIEFAPSAVGTVSLGVTVQLPTGCSAVSSVSLPVTSGSAVPEATITLSAPICASGRTSASVPDAGVDAVYYWTVQNGSIVSGQGTSSIVFDAGASGVVRVSAEATAAGGCTGYGAVSSPSFPLDTWVLLGGVPILGGEVYERPDASATLFLLGYGAVLRSDDSGSTWQRFTAGLPSTSLIDLTFDPTEPDTMFVCGWDMSVTCDLGGVYKSTDGGRTWTISSAWLDGLPATGGSFNAINVSAVAVDPNNPSTVYASAWRGAQTSMAFGSGTCPDGYGLFRSADQGVTWTRMTFYSAHELIVDPSTTPSRLYLVTSQGGNAWSSVVRSTDGGTTWNVLFPSTEGIEGIGIDPFDHSARFVYLNFNGQGGIRRSFDDGATWTDVSSAIPWIGKDVFDLVPDSNRQGRWYAATRYGVYVTSDSGTSWQPYNSGLADTVPRISASLIPGRFYASSRAGMFVTDRAPEITVTSVTPPSGSTAGGEIVTVAGSGFHEGSGVSFGSDAAQITSITSTSISAVTPAHIAGSVPVTISDPACVSVTKADAFTYVSSAPVVTSISPNLGPSAGGTTVAITGGGFSTQAGETTAMFGGASATGVTCASATTCSAISPPGTGTVSVSVTVGGRTSDDTIADDFTYIEPPTVSSLLPDKGSVLGGTVVFIQGANLGGTTSVTFAGSAATIDSATESSLTVSTPAGTAGAVAVVLTTPGGTVTLPAVYTYVVEARGDVNGDSILSAADVFYLINYLLAGGTPPYSSCGGDANSDGKVSVADVFFLSNAVFGGGPMPSPPGCM